MGRPYSSQVVGKRIQAQGGLAIRPRPHSWEEVELGTGALSTWAQSQGHTCLATSPVFIPQRLRHPPVATPQGSPNLGQLMAPQQSQ